MKKITILIVLLWAGFYSNAQNNLNKPLRIIAIGAHPDDCDSKFGGTAALFAKMGHKVKFVSLTNGDAGHQSMGGGVLGKRRRAEAKRSGKILGVEYDVLDNHDGELLPTLHVRNQVIREIRKWNADIVLCLRSNDYHPDHRNAGIVVQDAAYMVIVPNIAPDTPPLKKNPLFLYMQDGFQKPYPFSKDIAILIDDVIDQKVRALAAHESQFFEWMPWLGEMGEEEVPKNMSDKLIWLKKNYATKKTISKTDMELIKKWYTNLNSSNVQYAEFFEICEYGKQPSEKEIRQLFPMMNKN